MTQRSLFTRARAEISERLTGLPTGPDRFGLIHADLHLANVMTNNGALTIIDFDDAGYGWYPYELAVSLHPILDHPDLPDAYRSLVDGYRSVHPLTDDEVALVDLFVAMRCLMLVGWLDARRNLPTGRYCN
ncbi:MAG: phosphotransferase [Okeania sp. SIO4D6]|nr:phosphotransferase [Okeania sp. SIO4D6]